QYRTSRANNCDDSNAFNGSTWKDLDGSPDTFRSQNGDNAVTLPAGLVARCFQYRANLTSAGAPPKQSPALLNGRILVYVPGSTDLTVKSIDDTRAPGGNKLTGIGVTLLNHNSFGVQTLPANLETQGSFFVDLFVFYQNETVITPTVPLSAADKTRSK